MFTKHIFIIILTGLMAGCATLPSVTAPKLDKITFLDMTHQESVIAEFRVSEKGTVTFEQLIKHRPKHLKATYERNTAIYESESKKPKQYRDCIILKRNRDHQSCTSRPMRGSVLIKNEVTGAGLIAGAIMSPFIIFEATLYTLTGDTKGAKNKVREFEGATQPKFDHTNIKNIGDTILHELTQGYSQALKNGTEKGYLIAISRTSSEALTKANRISLSMAQDFLKQQKIYTGKVDGIWGNQTKQALETFQNQQRLDPTGQLDTATKISLSEQFEVTEFYYFLASRKNTIQAYEKFITQHPSSKHIDEAKSKKNRMLAIKRKKDAEIYRKQRLAREEKRRKANAAQRRELLSEMANARWQRGNLGHVCMKVNAVQRILELGFGEKWETCDVRILEVNESNVHVNLESYACGIGWNKDETKWLSTSHLMPRDDCDSYMHLLE